MKDVEKMSPEDANKLAESQRFPLSGEHELKTRGSFQYYTVKKDDKEYRLLYSENQSRLEDGFYDASLFQEALTSASIENSDGSFPKNTNELTIILKEN